MRPIYSKHARERMQQRRISEEEVEYTLAHPYLVEASRTSGNQIYRARPNGRQICVVVAPGTNPPIVVSAWD